MVFDYISFSFYNRPGAVPLSSQDLYPRGASETAASNSPLPRLQKILDPIPSFVSNPRTESQLLIFRVLPKGK